MEINDYHENNVRDRNYFTEDLYLESNEDPKLVYDLSIIGDEYRDIEIVDTYGYSADFATMDNHYVKMAPNDYLDGGTSGGSSGGSTSNTRQNLIVNIPEPHKYHTLNEAGTIVGQWINDAFGGNTMWYVNIPTIGGHSQRRLGLKIYDYNYLVVSSTGFKCKGQRKNWWGWGDSGFDIEFAGYIVYEAKQGIASEIQDIINQAKNMPSYNKGDYSLIESGGKAVVLAHIDLSTIQMRIFGAPVFPGRIELHADKVIKYLFDQAKGKWGSKISTYWENTKLEFAVKYRDKSIIYKQVNWMGSYEYSDKLEIATAIIGVTLDPNNNFSIKNVSQSEAKKAYSIQKARFKARGKYNSGWSATVGVAHNGN